MPPVEKAEVISEPLNSYPIETYPVETVGRKDLINRKNLHSRKLDPRGQIQATPPSITA